MRFPASGNSKGTCADAYGAIQLQGGPIAAFVANEFPYGYLGTSLEEIFGNGTGMMPY
jgi:hypothetical protein